MKKKADPNEVESVIVAFRGYITAIKADYDIEDPEALADLIPEERREEFGRLFHKTIAGIYARRREFHWQLGFLFFYMQVCHLYESIQVRGDQRSYGSFNEYIDDNQDDLEHGKSWIYKVAGVYRHYVWNLGIEPGHEWWPLLQAVGNFDVLEVMKDVCTPETVQEWLHYAAEKDDRGRTLHTKDDIDTQVEVWKQRMLASGATRMTDVTPITGVPKRTYKVVQFEGKPLYARQFRQYIPPEVPDDSEIEITYRVKKWGKL